MGLTREAIDVHQLRVRCRLARADAPETSGDPRIGPSLASQPAAGGAIRHAECAGDLAQRPLAVAQPAQTGQDVAALGRGEGATVPAGRPVSASVDAFAFHGDDNEAAPPALSMGPQG